MGGPGSIEAPPIRGVHAATAFLGRSSQGPVGRAVSIRSFVEFVRAFGPADSSSDLGVCVQQFFLNGGGVAWVVRIPDGGTASESLEALHEVSDLGLLCVPSEYDVDVLRAALAYAERRRAFMLVDPPGEDSGSAIALAGALREAGSSNAAIYYPRLRISGPDGTSERVIPPSGSVAGVFARVDASRGVWKVPAGPEATLIGAEHLQAEINEAETSLLGSAGVSVIRRFAGSGIRVWGSRTIAEPSSDWKFVPVRRTALFLHQSVERGTQWAVFEPNAEPLWAKLRSSVGSFLSELFRAGAFQGRTPAEAYFVQCGEDTMTREDVEHGRVNVLVGFAPVKPAEFLILRIGLHTAY